MTPLEIRGLIQELIEENPFAIRAVLKIVGIEFTGSVPTLAVTAEERPRLLINLQFVREHCTTPEHVKAVLCHEFLHVLLRHTTLRGPLTPARHLALDAVINAIIHRSLGPGYSGMMSAYYANAQGLAKLLRAMTKDEHGAFWQSFRSGGSPVPSWWTAWDGLYMGRVLADDLEPLANDFAASGQLPNADSLLGNHDDDEPLSDALERAVERAQKQLNGGGIWRGPGPGGNAYEILTSAKRAALEQWKKKTSAVLRKHLAPAPGAPRTDVPVTARLPVLSTSDRRAFMRATWSPFLPEAAWQATSQRPEGRAQVYLDVSGSMNAEMPLIVALLGQLSRWIRRPFWAFSTLVAPAVIENGKLRANTSGGTSLACALEHIAKTRPPAAVIVTDGFIEEIPKSLLATTARTRLHAIVTRDGNPVLLRKAGIPYSQLGRLPQ